MSDLVSTPEGALHYAEQSLSDAADSEAVIAVSVHQVGEEIVCNSWMRQKGKWEKMVPERVLGKEYKDTLSLLAGEVMRTVQGQGGRIDKDPRMSLAIGALLLKVCSLP